MIGDQKPEGVLFIDKPKEWTSFDAVNKIRYTLRKHFGQKIKVGHAGTLDPLATGLLIVCFGPKTKTISDYQLLPKTYTGVIRLGSTTPSFDLETSIDQEYDLSGLNKDKVLNACEAMTGKQLQCPPAYSAKRVDGERAYQKARAGEDIKLKETEIEIFRFEVDASNLPDVGFTIECSKGTYIRSIARDLGERLGVGGHLAELRRTAIGPYDLSRSVRPDEVLQRLTTTGGKNENAV